MILIDTLDIPSYMPKYIYIYIYILDVFCEIVYLKKKKKKNTL